MQSKNTAILILNRLVHREQVEIEQSVVAAFWNF